MSERCSARGGRGRRGLSRSGLLLLLWRLGILGVAPRVAILVLIARLVVLAIVVVFVVALRHGVSIRGLGARSPPTKHARYG